jgi:hypothetical protein
MRIGFARSAGILRDAVESLGLKRTYDHARPIRENA